MLLESIGLGVSAIGCLLGALLIMVGSFYYLSQSKTRFKNRFTMANAVRTIGIGIVLVTASIPFSIPNHLVATSFASEINIIGVIITSAFLEAPFVLMGLACFVGLNDKAYTLLEDRKSYHTSPIKKAF